MPMPHGRLCRKLTSTATMNNKGKSRSSFRFSPRCIISFCCLGIYAWQVTAQQPPPPINTVAPAVTASPSSQPTPHVPPPINTPAPAITSSPSSHPTTYLPPPINTVAPAVTSSPSSQPTPHVPPPINTVAPAVTASPSSQPTQYAPSPINTLAPAVTASPSSQPTQNVPPPMATQAPSSQPAAPAAAPLTWFLNPANGHSYALITTFLDWATAKTNAEAQVPPYQTCSLIQKPVPYLVTITSQAEQDFLTSNFASILPNVGWIGLVQAPGSAEPAGGFGWITNENFGPYTDWVPGEPNNGNCAPTVNCEGCVEVNPLLSLEWNDFPCSYTRPSIIEVDPIPSLVLSNGCDTGIVESGATCPITQTVDQCGTSYTGTNFDVCVRQQVADLFNSSLISQANMTAVYTCVPATNDPPTIVSVVGVPTTPILVGSNTGSLAVTCYDPNPNNVLLQVNWDDGNIDSSLIVAASSCQSSFSHVYSSANVYNLTVTATDVLSWVVVSNSYEVVVHVPTASPSSAPSSSPTTSPPSTSPTSSQAPSTLPSSRPSSTPTDSPSSRPSALPSSAPTSKPTSSPSTRPSAFPSSLPTSRPTIPPSSRPSGYPSLNPTSSASPSSAPSAFPSSKPTSAPTNRPSSYPSAVPSVSERPSTFPSSRPTSSPTGSPSSRPSAFPSSLPTSRPTKSPSSHPSLTPNLRPTSAPSGSQSSRPSAFPSSRQTSIPTRSPSSRPSAFPSSRQMSTPTRSPSSRPSAFPSHWPTSKPVSPSSHPSGWPSSRPSFEHIYPSSNPSAFPRSRQTSAPSSVSRSHPVSSSFPSSNPSDKPSFHPSFVSAPSHSPSTSPSSTQQSYDGLPLIVAVEGVPTAPIPVGITVGSVTVVCNDTVPGHLLIQIDWGDGQVDSTIAAAPSACEASFSHIYHSANLYSITVLAKDVNSSATVTTNSYEVVVYDPNAGFLTAGDMQFQNGKATIGFICTYNGNLVVNNTVVVRDV